MPVLLDNQLTAINKLRQFKVGALFMEPGAGKTRAAYELVKSVPGCDYVLWLTPFQTKGNLAGELLRCMGDEFIPIEITGIETLSSSNTYLKLTDELSKSSRPFIVVDESLKIKNWDAIITKRIIELGKMAEYKLVLNGTISRNLLDIWAQYDQSRDKYILVDGFHRWLVMLTHKDIYERENGLIMGINKQVTETAREVLGQFLKNKADELQLTLFKIEKSTGLQGKQIKAVFDGSENYTINSLLSIIHALDLYIFFAEKEGHHLDPDHMFGKMTEKDPYKD